MHSRIPLSCVPLTRENQLVALAPWTPNFSDAPLVTAHMTDPVTHMCWSEQISPLAYSSQATWQAFNLSHCIEMHNTHLLSCAGQLSQTYFTHLVRFWLPAISVWLSTNNLTKAAISRVPDVTSHSLQHQPKNWKCRDARHIFSMQIQFRGRYNRSIELYLAFLLYQ